MPFITTLILPWPRSSLQAISMPIAMDITQQCWPVPHETLATGLSLTFVPYFLLRGLIERVARRWSRETAIDHRRAADESHTHSTSTRSVLPRLTK